MLPAENSADDMSFLDAPYVQRSMEEAEFLKARLLNQTEIVLNTKGEDLQVALDYLHTLYALVEKEHMLYTRFMLSDDMEAHIAASKLDGAKIATEDNNFANGDQFYRALKEDIKNALTKLDDTDLDEPFEIW